MRYAARFIIALVFGLAFVTWVASVIVQRTTHDWFERDLNLRAQLAVTGARQALISHWRDEQRSTLGELLSEITRDERIMAAAACRADSTLLTQTQDFPGRFTCAEIAERVRSTEATMGATASPWRSVESLPGGDVHVTAIPVLDQDLSLGFVVLVQDLSFVERREATTRWFLLVGFGFLALAASVVTVLAARLSWRGWSSDLRKLLRGGSQPVEFQPIMRDVRDLVDRMVAEREADGEGGAWTPQRLKQTLNRYLHGEKVVILANREPYIHDRLHDGQGVRVVHPASGLVTALEPVMRACSGVWVAHGSGSADRETSDRAGRIRVPPGEESYFIRRLWLTPAEEKGYYYGFANEALWPLCHIVFVRPTFRKRDWDLYRKINRRFADERMRVLREEFRKDVKILGTAEGVNQSLEKALRVDDFMELAELKVRDALHREESCGGHFREEHQTPEGEALRDDENFAYVGAWEYAGPNIQKDAVLHKEPLVFESVPLSQRSYK
mgnify:CR=1 FL=1